MLYSIMVLFGGPNLINLLIYPCPKCQIERIQLLCLQHRAYAITLLWRLIRGFLQQLYNNY